MASLEFRLHPIPYHPDSDLVPASFGEDHIGIALGRFDEFQVHWTHGREILIDDILQSPSPLQQVSPQTPNEAYISRDVDEDLDIEEWPEPGVGK